MSRYLEQKQAQQAGATPVVGPSRYAQQKQEQAPSGKIIKAPSPRPTPPEGSLLGVKTPEAPSKKGNFITNAPDNVRALVRGDFSVGDVAKEAPGVVSRGATATSETVIPGLHKFGNTTMSIFGEGLAYAIDPNVRKQYNAGNLDILPTITNTTQKDLAKYTLAAGIEAAIMKALPQSVKGKWTGSKAARFGLGTVEGLGFALSEGLARGYTAEQVMKNAGLYGVSGGFLNLASPYILPLLKRELSLGKTGAKEVAEGITRKVKVKSSTPGTTPVPVSTYNKRYEAYLRSQGYEPYYVRDIDLPTIDVGPTPKKKANGLPTIRYDNPPTDMPAPAGTKLVYDKPDVAPRAPQTAPARAVPTQAVPEQAVPAPREKVTSNLERVEMPSSRMPVGTGTEKQSSLSARLSRAYQKLHPETPLDESLLPRYRKMNMQEQKRLADTFVGDLDIPTVNDIVRGRTPLPEGLLRNGFLEAAGRKAAQTGDDELLQALSRDIASLESTRYGQEIAYSRMFEPDNPFGQMEAIITSRAERAVRQKGGKLVVGKEAVREVREMTEKEVGEVVSRVKKSRVKISKAEEIINSLLC